MKLPSSTGASPASGAAQPRLVAEYVLPLRWRGEEDEADLSAYLSTLAEWIDVTVVDGSSDEIYARHREQWPSTVRQLRPGRWPGGNGKVAGVVTGVRASRHARIVIADDDVRWDRDGLHRAIALLDDADLVRPQNYFGDLPWHARWDTGRTLLNRAFGSDYPGTYALRRDPFLRMGGYDGNALFENLELARTVRAAGGSERCVDDLFVLRRPPSARHFLGQRVRQAYDDLAQPARLIVEATILPALAVACWTAHSRAGLIGVVAALAGSAAAVVAVAEYGRRRADGRRVFRAASALWAPLWLAERAVCVWLALGQRCRGGVHYGSEHLRLAAHRPADLRERLRHVPPLESLVLNAADRALVPR